MSTKNLHVLMRCDTSGYNGSCSIIEIYESEKVAKQIRDTLTEDLAKAHYDVGCSRLFQTPPVITFHVETHRCLEETPHG